MLRPHPPGTYLLEWRKARFFDQHELETDAQEWVTKLWAASDHVLADRKTAAMELLLGG